MQRQRLIRNQNISTVLLIAACFFLTSSVWMSWEYHLTDFLDTLTVDYLSMVAGYLLQAAGIALFSLMIQKRPHWFRPGLLTLILLLFLGSSAVSILPSSPGVSIVSGLFMNLLCGLIAGFYLHVLTFLTGPSHKGLVFGSGYGCAVICTWLFSRIRGEGSFLTSPYALIAYAAVTGLIILWIVLSGKDSFRFGMVPPEISPAESANAAASADRFGGHSAQKLRSLFLQTGIIVFLFSLVKNLGFGFPTADILGGVSVELSRIFYAAGLVCAGYIIDRNRKQGALCAAASLVISFIGLALSGEQISAMVIWCLEYLFFGFFSVFRIVVFSDLCRSCGCAYLAGLGLCLGRVGDAAGTVICNACADHKFVLVVGTAALFILSLFLFYRFFLQTWILPQPAVRTPDEQETLERFSMINQLSFREKDVLKEILSGKTNAEIAGTLFVSESTIKFHVHNLLKKTGCRNRSELISKYKAEVYQILPGQPD
ncbi:MAG: helix-turn-helix transcriptional regulator [Parasporobacterium sp.]|nr:helix-turn-helix transcriptional regulator [Parasporobacterium sp.]